MSCWTHLSRAPAASTRMWRHRPRTLRPLVQQKAFARLMSTECATSLRFRDMPDVMRRPLREDASQPRHVFEVVLGAAGLLCRDWGEANLDLRNLPFGCRSPRNLAKRPGVGLKKEVVQCIQMFMQLANVNILWSCVPKAISGPEANNHGLTADSP